MKHIEIESEAALAALLKEKKEIQSYAFQNIDFSAAEDLISGHSFKQCLFLGCPIPDKVNEFIQNDCLIFPVLDVPYNPYIRQLYTRDTLLSGYKPDNTEWYKHSPDVKIYNHYLKTGIQAEDIKETLARRLHDHSITDAKHDFLKQYDEKKVVAIMGGHSMLRSNPSFHEVALVSKKLTEKGYLMVSGGGPGAMEATHVGAHMAGKNDADLEKVIKIIAEAPSYKDKLWMNKAFEAIHLYPESEFESLGVPTWLYGHEPPTPFASKIAKYFANSVREDGLLTIAKGGVIFSPGSAGTIQEIFQDVTQNHYLSFDYASPMVFLNKHYWNKERPIYPLLEQMLAEGKFSNLILSAHDKPEDIVSEILKFE